MTSKMQRYMDTKEQKTNTRDVLLRDEYICNCRDHFKLTMTLALKHMNQLITNSGMTRGTRLQHQPGTTIYIYTRLQGIEKHMNKGKNE